MSDKQKVSLLSNMNMQTEILESLNWNEEKCKELMSYLDKTLNDDILSHPTVVLKEINEMFGEATKQIIKKAFDAYILATNLHLSRSDCEH